MAQPEHLATSFIFVARCVGLFLSFGSSSTGENSGSKTVWTTSCLWDIRSKVLALGGWIRYLAGSFAQTGNRIIKTAVRNAVFITPRRIRQSALPAPGYTACIAYSYTLRSIILSWQPWSASASIWTPAINSRYRQQHKTCPRIPPDLFPRRLKSHAHFYSFCPLSYSDRTINHPLSHTFLKTAPFLSILNWVSETAPVIIAIPVS